MKIINTGLAAYGSSGKLFHAPFIEAHPGFKLVGAWERSDKNFTKDYPSAKSYDTFSELLSSNCDLIIINTPVETHFHYAKLALEAGKNILVEKAFTSSLEEAEHLSKLVNERNLKLCVYQNRRYDSDFKTVQKIISQNILGDIKDVEIRFERFNLNLSQKKWKETPNSGSGILMDLGPHIIDQSLVLFGYPQKIFATLRKTRPNTLIDDYVDISLFYPIKIVRLKASFVVKEPTPAYVIHGTKGSFLKSRADIQEDELKKGVRPDSDIWGVESATEKGYLITETKNKRITSEKGNYMEFYDLLYSYLVENKKPPVSMEEILQTMKIIQAARESHISGKIIDLY